MLMPVLCGAVGFGTVGHLENAMTFSPLQLVIDNLADSDFQEFPGTPPMGRQFSLGVILDW